MTYEELRKANEAIKPTDLKGKEYAEVNQRIKAFRMLYPEGRIITEMVSLVDGVVIFKASALNTDGVVLGTGTAYEKENSTFINKTSFIENCETSAVGRALAMLGIGIDVSIASKEEVDNAKANQGKAEAPRKAEKKVEKKTEKAQPTEAPKKEESPSKSSRDCVLDYIKRHKMSNEDIAKICKAYGIEKLEDITQQMAMHYISALRRKGGNINE